MSDFMSDPDNDTKFTSEFIAEQKSLYEELDAQIRAWQADTDSDEKWNIAQCTVMRAKLSGLRNYRDAILEIERLKSKLASKDVLFKALLEVKKKGDAYKLQHTKEDVSNLQTLWGRFCRIMDMWEIGK